MVSVYASLLAPNMSLPQVWLLSIPTYWHLIWAGRRYGFCPYQPDGTRYEPAAGTASVYTSLLAPNMSWYMHEEMVMGAWHSSLTNNYQVRDLKFYDLCWSNKNNISQNEPPYLFLSYIFRHFLYMPKLCFMGSGSEGDDVLWNKGENFPLYK